MRSSHHKRMPARQNMVTHKFRSRAIRQSTIQNCLNLHITPAHRIADHTEVGSRYQIRRIEWCNRYSQFTQIVGHRRINTRIGTGHPPTAGLRQCGNCRHRRAAHTQNVKMLMVATFGHPEIETQTMRDRKKIFMHHAPMSLHTLPTITVETGQQPTASIIWLHGLGADGHDFEPIVPQLGLPDTLAIRFIFPNAPSMPVTLNGGYIMPAWYDIKQSDLGVEHDRQGIIHSARMIQLLIEQELLRDISPDRIIIAGFSQGAAMALYTGLRQQPSLGGIIALSGYLLLPEDIEQCPTTNRTTPIFMAHGINDPIVPLVLGDQARRSLESIGYAVTWHTYPMEHHVCHEEIRHIGQWITQTLSQ